MIFISEMKKNLPWKETFHLKRNMILIYRIVLLAKKLDSILFLKIMLVMDFYRVLIFPNKIGMATKGMGYFCQISSF